jgi:hypothetical protein
MIQVPEASRNGDTVSNMEPECLTLICAFTMFGQAQFPYLWNRNNKILSRKKIFHGIVSSK